MERPMAIIGIPFFLSLVLASFLELRMTAVLAAAAFLAFLTVLCLRRLRRNRRLLAILMAVAAAFSLYSAKEALIYRPLQRWDGRTAHLRLETRSFADDPDDPLGLTAVVVGGDLPRGTQVMLGLYGDAGAPDPYDIVEGVFTLSTPDEEILRGAKASGVMLRAVSAYANEGEVSITPAERRGPMAGILELRRGARLAVASQPGGEDVSGLMNGVAFGFKSGLSSELKAQFRSLGVSHLLAVSGLHLTFLATAVMTLLRALRVRRRLAAALSIAVVLLFMALTGFTPSVTRAGIMNVLVLFGLMIGREPDGLNSLGFALLLMTAGNPYAACDAGLMMSAGATFGLLTLYPALRRVTADRLRKREDPLRHLARPADALAVTLAATAPILPVTLLLFGQLSLVAPLANFLMVPVASAVMIPTCVGALCAQCTPLAFASGVLLWIGRMAARLLWGIAELLCRLPVVSVNADRLYLLAVIPAGMLLILLGWRLLGRRGARVAALWSVIALLCGTIPYGLLMRGVTTVTLYETGNGVTALIERGGRYGMVLAGDIDAVWTAAQAASTLSVDTLDFLVVGNADDDCAFGAMKLTDRIAVKNLVYGDGLYQDTLDGLPGVERRFDLSAGGVRFWDDGRVERLEGGFLRVTVGDTRLLFCPEEGGDAARLPVGQRQTHLAVFDGAPPKNLAAITTSAGVLCSPKETLTATMKAFLGDAYPVRATANGDVTVQTRGRGDVEIRQ